MFKTRRLLMKRTLFNIFLVTVGAAIGSVVTWRVLENKYEQIVQEEIESVKEEYKNMRDMLYSAEAVSVNNKVKQELSNEVDTEDSEEDVFKPTSDAVFEYHKITSTYRSSEDYNDKEGGNGESEEAPYINGPYVISPDDFRCSPPGYNAQALDYFSDGVLADGWGKVLDIEDTIGTESLNHFGEYVDDLLYVRNERLEIDYEITNDMREYSSVYGTQYDV
jgi:hypothetical protein